MHRPIRREVPVLEGIQYLRGVAAMMVVFHHARHEFGGALSVSLGARGVDIFFVISGLVMMYSTRGASLGNGLPTGERFAQALAFWKKRFVRVAPVYWIALLLSATFLARIDLNDWTLLQDALFIPHWSTTHPNRLWPALVPGWSLNYEMFFYLLFGLSFLFGRRGVLFTCISVVGLCALRRVTTSDTAGFQFYTDPVMLNFIAGILLYFAIEAVRWQSLVPSRWVLVMALAAGFIDLGLSSNLGAVLIRPMLCSMIVISAVFLFDGVQLRPLRVLGDASYSIYLFHLLSFLLAHEIIASIGISAGGKLGVAVTFGVYLSVAAVCGVAAHYFVERPLIKAVAKLLAFGRARPEAVMLKR